MTDESNDWVTVVNKKPKQPSTGPKTIVKEQEPEEVHEWEQVTILRKRNIKPKTVPQLSNVRPNIKPNTDKGIYYKLDSANTSDSLNKVKLSVGQMIQQERGRQGMSQADLINKVGGKAKLTLFDLQQIEKGTAIQSNVSNKITAIENSLNYRVRGKLAGQCIHKAK